MSVEHLRQDLVFTADLVGRQFTFHTTWGIFSPRGIDEGTSLLLDHLKVKKDDVALDMGCGYGPIGLSIAHQASQGRVHMVDKDFLAIAYAGSNAKRNGLNNVEAYLSNGLSHVPENERFDLVVSNLPAKVGNEFFQIMFHDVHRQMQPGARFVVVTINGLRGFIKRSFTETFGNYTKLKQGKSYTISMAVLEP